MAIKKFRMPTEEEVEILRRNGIDPVGVAVILREDNMIVVLRHKTRDEITLRQGGKPW